MIRFLFPFLCALQLATIPVVARADYVLTKDSSYGVQSYYEGESFPKSWIEQRYAEGKGITAASSRNGKWTVVMSANSGFTKQAYLLSNDMPYGWINEKRDDSYFVTSIASRDKQVLVVMSRGAKFLDQRLPNAGMFSLPNGGNDYRLTALMKIRWTFYPVESTGSGITDQVAAMRSTFPADFISDNWKKNFRITSLFYLDEWYVVMSKTNGTVWGEQCVNSADKLKEALEQGWKVKLSY